MAPADHSEEGGTHGEITQGSMDKIVDAFDTSDMAQQPFMALACDRNGFTTLTEYTVDPKVRAEYAAAVADFVDTRARTAHTPPLTHTHPTHTHGTYVCGFGYAWPPLECWCPSDTTGEANQSSQPMAPARNRSVNATGEVRCACGNSTAACHHHPTACSRGMAHSPQRSTALHLDTSVKGVQAHGCSHRPS